MILDNWQKEVLEVKGNLCLCSGRQVGKSTIISQKSGDSAISSTKSIMIIASTERQALLLFEKVLSHIFLKAKNQIQGVPTKHELKLINGSVIRCLPTGDSGYGIRGYTIDELYADEAAFIPEDVWAAVTPMLATTGGTINLLSTPFGTTGYFYRCFHDDKFTSIHVNTENVAKERPDPQKTMMLEFLKDEKDRMTKLQYKQEYLGLFVGGIMRFFPDELINERLTLTGKEYIRYYQKFQGIDIARLGGDETVLVSVNMSEQGKLKMFDLTIPENQKLTDTARLIIHKDKLLNHKNIFIDDGGLGVGVFDMLFEDPQTKRKVVGINNSKRVYERDSSGKEIKERTKILLKEDLYNNLKRLMENGDIDLMDDPRVKQSLRSIQCEFENNKLQIYGNYSHITEAIIRASYCTKSKSLNIRSFC